MWNRILSIWFRLLADRAAYIQVLFRYFFRQAFSLKLLNCCLWIHRFYLFCASLILWCVIGCLLCFTVRFFTSRKSKFIFSPVHLARSCGSNYSTCWGFYFSIKNLLLSFISIFCKYFELWLALGCVHSPSSPRQISAFAQPWLLFLIHRRFNASRSYLLFFLITHSRRHQISRCLRHSIRT